MGQATVATRRLSLGVIRDGDSAEEVTANQPFLFPLPGEMVLPAPEHFLCPNYTSNSGSRPCPATPCIPISHSHTHTHTHTHTQAELGVGAPGQHRPAASITA